MRARPAHLGAALAAATSAFALSGCGSADGQALALQACAHVDRSLALYAASLKASSPAVSHREQAQAYDQLRAALPLAAMATSNDGRWNALMTTISESARVQEALLTTALRDQCEVAENKGPYSTAVPPAPGQ